MDKEIVQQAIILEATLPRIMRRIFTLAINHPAGDLPVAQLRTCSFLLNVGASSTTELAEELGVSVSAATQIADRLEKCGFVERMSDRHDRRIKILALTEQGKALMTERRNRRLSRVTEILDTIPAEKRDTIMAAVETLLDATVSLSAQPHGVPPVSLPTDIAYSYNNEVTN
jgi:DNA-binding MarR family transcriptional regulator